MRPLDEKSGVLPLKTPQKTAELLDFFSVT
jgi:hypothetical protein